MEKIEVRGLPDALWETSVMMLQDGAEVRHLGLLLTARREGGLVTVVYQPSGEPLTPPVKPSEVATLSRAEWDALSRKYLAARALLRAMPTSIDTAVGGAYTVHRPGDGSLIMVEASVDSTLNSISLHWLDRGVKLSLTRTGVEVSYDDLRISAEYDGPQAIIASAAASLVWRLR